MHAKKPYSELVNFRIEKINANLPEGEKIILLNYDEYNDSVILKHERCNRVFVSSVNSLTWKVNKVNYENKKYTFCPYCDSKRLNKGLDDKRYDLEDIKLQYLVFKKVLNEITDKFKSNLLRKGNFSCVAIEHFDGKEIHNFYISTDRNYLYKFLLNGCRCHVCGKTIINDYNEYDHVIISKINEIAGNIIYGKKKSDRIFNQM